MTLAFWWTAMVMGFISFVIGSPVFIGIWWVFRD